MKPQEEEIDRLVRQRLLDADQSASDWDLPSEQVWVSIDNRIHDKKRDRGAIWWVFAGLLVLSVSIMLLFQLSEPAALPSANTQVGIAEISQSPVFTKEASADVQSTSSELSSELSMIPKDQVNTASQSTLSPEVPRSTNDIKQLSSQLTGIANSTIPLVVSPAIIENEGNISGTENTADQNSNAESESLLINTERKNASRTSVDVAYLDSEMFFLTLEETPFSQVEALPMIAVPQHNAWSLAVSISPSLGTRRIVVPNAQPRVRRNLLLQQEEPAVQLGFGVSAMHELTARWSIEGGVEYSRFLLNSSSTHQIRYSRIGEIQNAQGNFENRFRLNLNTSYGELNTDVVVERSSDSQMEEHQFINLALQTKQSMQVLRIPVSARYNIPLGSSQASCYAGLSANVLIENSLEFRAVQSLDSEIIQVSTMRNARLSSYKDFAFGYQFGVEFEVPLYRRMSILFGPSVNGYLQPVYQNRQVLIYPLMADMNVGVRYRL